MIVLDIPRIPPSLNELLGYHWRYRARTSKVWQEEVYYALRQAGHDSPSYAKARVTIDRRSVGQLDPDNLVGAMKPVIDALRYSHVIVDDTPDHLELVVTQSCSRKLRPRTLIQIDPIPT